MKDFISIDIKSKLDRIKVLQIFTQQLPDFTWRTGESDAMGGYVSGQMRSNPDKVQDR